MRSPVLYQYAVLKNSRKLRVQMKLHPPEQSDHPHNHGRNGNKIKETAEMGKGSQTE